MGLKTRVKVGNVSNLSDARYCAGMGVDYLGFAADPNSQNYINPELYSELKSWIEGPGVVLQIEGLNQLGKQLIDTYLPQFIETTAAELQLLSSYDIPIILNIRKKEDLALINAKVQHVQLSEESLFLLDLIPTSIHIWVHPGSNTNVTSLIENRRIFGLALEGGLEERPGFKSFDDLANVLEILEVD